MMREFRISAICIERRAKECSKLKELKWYGNMYGNDVSCAQAQAQAQAQQELVG